MLTDGLPMIFSLVTVFRMPGKTSKDTWTLMSVTAPTGITMFALTFNVSFTLFHVLLCDKLL